MFVQDATHSIHSTSCFKPIVDWCGRQVERIGSPLSAESYWLELLIRIALLFSIIIPLIGMFAPISPRSTPPPPVVVVPEIKPPPVVLPTPPLDEMSLVAEVIPSAPTLQTTVLEIEEIYEEILQDLNKLYQPLGTHLYKMIQETEETYPALSAKSEEDENSKLFNRFHYVKDNFLFLRSLRFALFMRFGGIGEKMRIEVPRDGNCLYHATLEKLVALKLADPQTTHLDLRRQAIDWLEAHQDEPEVQSKLLDSLNSYKVEQAEKAQLDRVTYINLLQDSSQGQLRASQVLAATQRVDELDTALKEIHAISMADYLKLAREDRFFGATAEVYAIAKLHEVTINVENNQLDKVQEIFNPGQKKQMTLLFNGTHFDVQAIN